MSQASDHPFSSLPLISFDRSEEREERESTEAAKTGKLSRRRSLYMFSLSIYIHIEREERESTEAAKTGKLSCRRSLYMFSLSIYIQRILFFFFFLYLKIFLACMDLHGLNLKF